MSASSWFYYKEVCYDARSYRCGSLLEVFGVDWLSIQSRAENCCTAYTGCPRRNVKYFGRVFLMLNYTDITQNTYIQS